MKLNSHSDQFYAGLSDKYDVMTKDTHRWDTLRELYHNLLDKSDIHSILDVGCGTGGEAIALSEGDYSIVGVDAAQEFIDIAIRKAKGLPDSPEFRVDDMRRLATIETESVDLVVCRGNTLPHLLTAEEIRSAFVAFSRVARPGGNLVLQWLNYIPVLRDRRRLVGVGGDPENVFIRFYDFESDGKLTFNIVYLSHDRAWKQEWNSTLLMPWVHNEVELILRETGWEISGRWADMRQNSFVPEDSRDVTLLALLKS